jgi:hypothetical protein
MCRQIASTLSISVCTQLYVRIAIIIAFAVQRYHLADVHEIISFYLKIEGLARVT